VRLGQFVCVGIVPQRNWGATQMKHTTFQSSYKPEFEVVEQREGKLRLYPHTEQLPVLLRALNLEFYGRLPARLARLDARGSAFDKITLRNAALLFCAYVNASREDSLRLMALPDRDLVTRIALVQQITQEHRRGLVHEFRFFAGEDFFTDIFLSGKRVRFADHMLKRFDQRVPTRIGEDLTFFLTAFYSCPLISMPVGAGRALITLYDKTVVLAFPYDEKEDEYFVKTCLTANEMNSLEPELPPSPLNFHYDKTFTWPKIRNWVRLAWMLDLVKAWRSKKLPEMAKLPPKPMSWHDIASWVKDVVARQGHGEGSRISFIDHIPGPCVLECKPGQVEARIDESEEIKLIEQEHKALSERRQGAAGVV